MSKITDLINRNTAVKQIADYSYNEFIKDYVPVNELIIAYDRKMIDVDNIEKNVNDVIDNPDPVNTLTDESIKNITGKGYKRKNNINHKKRMKHKEIIKQIENIKGDPAINLK